MPNKRAQVNRALGLQRTSQGQRVSDGYTNINVAGAGRADHLELAPLSSALAGAAAQRQIAKERDAMADGRAALQNPETADAINSAVAAEGSGGTLEEQRERTQAAFAKLAADGTIPEAANPFFQVALQTGTARRLAGKAKSELMSRVSEFANLNDEDGNPLAPPSADEMISEVFSQYEGNYAVQSRYGRDQFTAQRESIEEQFRAQVAQVRTEALTIEGRRNALNEIIEGTEAESGLADIAVADETTPGMLDELSAQLTRHHDAGVRDVRGLFLEGLALQAAEAAEDNPDRALRMIRQAELVRVGNQALGEDARSQEKLSTLRRSIEQEAETRDAREFAKADRSRSQIVSLSSGRVNARLLEAADSGESLFAAERAVLAEIRQDPELRGIAGDLSPAQLQATLGDVRDQARRIRRSMESDVSSSSKQLLNDIDVMRANGTDPEAIRATIDRGLETGELAGRDAIQIQTQIDGDTVATKVTQASPAFQRAARRFSPSTVPTSLGSVSRTALLEEQSELQSWVDESVRQLVGDTTNPAEHQAKLNEFLASDDYQSRVTAFEAKVTTKGAEADGSIDQITGLIDGNDFEAAETAIAEAKRTNALSGAQIDGLRSRQRQVRTDLGRQVNNSDALRNAREAAVAEGLRFAIEAQPTLTADDQSSIEADLRAQFQAGAADGIRDAIKGVPSELQEVALAKLGDSLRTQLVSEFQSGTQRPTEGEDPLVSEDAVRDLGLRRSYGTASKALDQASESRVPRNYGAAVTTDLVPGVDPLSFKLRNSLDSGAFAGGFVGLGAVARPRQREVMQQHMLSQAAKATKPKDFSKAYTQLRGTDRITAKELGAGGFSVNHVLTAEVAKDLGVQFDGWTGDSPIISPNVSQAYRDDLAARQRDVKTRTGLDLQWKPLQPGSKYGRYHLSGAVPVDDESLNLGMVEIDGWGSLSRPKKVALLGRFGYETDTPTKVTEALDLVNGFQETTRIRNAR